MSANDRQNIIKELPSSIAEPAMKLNKAATGASADDFLKILEEESLSICDVMLKKQAGFIFQLQRRLTFKLQINLFTIFKCFKN